MTIRVLAKFERTICSCDKCISTCRTKPGCLSPSDIDRIAEHQGHKVARPEWIFANFQATMDGPDDTPAIRPAQKKNGDCVFLSAEGRCTIHQVAPFECTRARACEPEDSAPALVALGKANGRSVDQNIIWLKLREHQGQFPETSQP